MSGGCWPRLWPQMQPRSVIELVPAGVDSDDLLVAHVDRHYLVAVVMKLEHVFRLGRLHQLMNLERRLVHRQGAGAAALPVAVLDDRTSADTLDSIRPH